MLAERSPVGRHLAIVIAIVIAIQQAGARSPEYTVERSPFVLRETVPVTGRDWTVVDRHVGVGPFDEILVVNDVAMFQTYEPERFAMVLRIGEREWWAHLPSGHLDVDPPEVMMMDGRPVVTLITGNVHKGHFKTNQMLCAVGSSGAPACICLNDFVERRIELFEDGTATETWHGTLERRRIVVP